MDIASNVGGINLRIKRFFPAPRYDRDPNSEVVDWVEYYPATQAGQTLVCKPVSEILSIAPMTDPQNPSQNLAHQRKAAVEPAYKAWKNDMTVPLNGMPLSAWQASGFTPNHAQIILHAGIRTVEELADATDSMIALIKLPNPRDLRTLAQRWVAAKDTNGAAKALEEERSQNAALRDQLSEMGAAMKELQAAVMAMRQQQQVQQPVFNAADIPTPPPRRARRPSVDEIPDPDKAVPDEVAA